MSETKRRSVQQEKRLAATTGGQVSAGSGSGWKRKSDVRSPRTEDTPFLWEAKRTDAKSFSLKLDDWEKNRRYALSEGRTPAMHVEIGKRRLVVLEEDDFMELLDR